MKEFILDALSEAQKAFGKGETPIGCVIVKGGKAISRAHNQKGPIGHAEMIALIAAGKDARGAEAYATLEPCPMCCWALISSGVKKIVFGAYDYSYGACGSYINLLSHPIAKGIECYGGIMEDECSKILSDFFRSLRQK